MLHILYFIFYTYLLIIFRSLVEKNLSLFLLNLLYALLYIGSFYTLKGRNIFRRDSNGGASTEIYQTRRVHIPRLPSACLRYLFS